MILLIATSTFTTSIFSNSNPTEEEPFALDLVDETATYVMIRSLNGTRTRICLRESIASPSTLVTLRSFFEKMEPKLGLMESGVSTLDLKAAIIPKHRGKVVDRSNFAFLHETKREDFELASLDSVRSEILGQQIEREMMISRGKRSKMADSIVCEVELETFIFRR